VPALGTVAGWHGVPVGVLDAFDCDDAGGVLPWLLLVVAELCAVEPGAFAPAGLFAGLVAAPGPEGVAVLCELLFAGHGTICPAFGPGFGDAVFCCVPVGGVEAVGGVAV